MLTKLLISILTALHLLAPTSNTNAPRPTPVEIRTPASPKTASLSIGDEVYADIALQHEINHVSVYYFDDNPQNTVSINADASYDPASTIKLYVAMYAFDQVASGNISLDQVITVQDKNVVPSQEFPYGYPQLVAGQTVSVSELLDRMITQSGNSSYNTLIDLLDRTKITKYVHDLGLVNSSIGSKLNLDDNQETLDSQVPGFGPNTTNADDYAIAFILINGRRLPGSASLFNMLARQKFNSMIPALLPKEVVVAHKTGELDPYYHDGGIIIDPNSSRRYILSVFSDLGDPNVVAHISNLVYTNNTNEVGNNQTNKVVSEIPDAPIDPIVTQGETTETKVLAASTQNIKLPAIIASDLGINAQDISGALSTRELPPVLIPADSRFHFLIDLGEKIRTSLNPFPTLKLAFETQNLTLTLSEANNLIKRNKMSEANTILEGINSDLSQIAKNGLVAGNPSLQNSISQISETRFSILRNEITDTTNNTQRTDLIKQVARQAKETIENTKPFITDGAKSSDLNQIPVVGKVVSTTANSITVKEGDGSLVTKPLGSEVRTRDSNTTNTILENATQIPVGSVVALAGGSSDNTIKPSFILTNIASESANPRPVTILKVNKTTNTIVIVPSSGIPEQVDLTKQTIIKGSDTTISLDTLKPGNILVVHGEQIQAPSASGSATPNASPGTLESPIPSTSVSNQTTTAPVVIKGSSIPSSSVPSAQKTAPVVIRGDVIRVIEHSKPTNKETPEKKKEAPPVNNPIPPATPVKKH